LQILPDYGLASFLNPASENEWGLNDYHPQAFALYFSVIFLYILRTGSGYVAEAGFKLVILLPGLLSAGIIGRYHHSLITTF
jgi:hypothetical protein